MNYLIEKKIPKVVFPSIDQYTIRYKDESLISISQKGILCDSQYYKRGIPGSCKDCYARRTVVELLLKAQQSLPSGYRLLVFDAYRTIRVQQHLWDYYRQDIKDKYPELTDEEIEYRTSFVVSKPSYDAAQPSLHNTGDAVELTIIDANGELLDMGTDFDAFTNRAWTRYYENTEESIKVRDNRRMLYWAMINAGFTNLPSEWWHYDYGTKKLGIFKKYRCFIWWHYR